MRCETTFLEKVFKAREISRCVRTICTAAEFRGQVLITGMLLLKQLCIPIRCDPMRAGSVCELVYALNHNLNHQWTP
ncbi:unnamed protein product [Hymenolepis diminuta]|uniref:Uncharacterized protein n=1 Tax=Hymenolepis diminuta TaxID=6216 RepID=A0A564XWL6_HYMDI|nr:unnamed protein product [Hymenolepis diminuta]